jgi:hypothetical protein
VGLRLWEFESPRPHQKALFLQGLFIFGCWRSLDAINPTSAWVPAQPTPNRDGATGLPIAFTARKFFGMDGLAARTNDGRPAEVAVPFGGVRTDRPVGVDGETPSPASEAQSYGLIDRIEE